MLSLSSFSVDMFVDALVHTDVPTVLLSEICCSLITVILSDSALAIAISKKIPREAHFGHRGGSDRTSSGTAETYNGLRLLPEKLTSHIVRTLTWQVVLRTILPYLPPYVELQEQVQIRQQALQVILHDMNFIDLLKCVSDEHGV
jgi:hypothetical protein